MFVFAKVVYLLNHKIYPTVKYKGKNNFHWLNKAKRTK